MSKMGKVVRNEWSEEEERKFEEGILKHGRDFSRIQSDFLRHKSIGELVLYYYNVWKQRRTPAAGEYYSEKRKREEDARKEAELHRLESLIKRKQRSEESKKRRLDKNQQKKLKETLLWIKTIARQPDHRELTKSRTTPTCAVRMAGIYRTMQYR